MRSLKFTTKGKITVSSTPDGNDEQGSIDCMADTGSDSRNKLKKIFEYFHSSRAITLYEERITCHFKQVETQSEDSCKNKVKEARFSYFSFSENERKVELDRSVDWI